MENNNNTYILENYNLSDFHLLDNLKNDYPHIKFTKVTSSLYVLQVEDGYQDELTKLSNSIYYVNPPTLYGLNAEQALDVSNISQFHTYPYGELRGSDILIGFVDTGIDYQNDFFKNADNTTRIVSIWDQTIEGNPPDPFNYGTVYTEEDINNALKSSNPLSIVPSTDDSGHGTFLAGLAAGNDQSGADMFTGGAPDSKIIMVRLRQAGSQYRDMYVVNSTARAYQSNDILCGVQFVVNTASQLGKPLVLCIGLGNNYGPHDGSTTIERYLEIIGKNNGVIVVVAAGNETNAGHHFREENVLSQTEVEFNIADAEPGFVMNLWADISNIVSVSFKSPLGQIIDHIPMLNGTMQTFQFNLEPTILNLRYYLPNPVTGAQSVAIRFINPIPGLWTMIVKSENNVPMTFDVWLPRRGFINDDTYFLKSTPKYTVQIPATAEYLVTVGAYDPIDGSIYISSGRGPTTNGLIKPDFLAPGVNVQGPRVGGGFTTFIGTSTSAAITASAAALLLEWAIINKKLVELNTRIARGIFIRGAKRTDGSTYPNSIEGYGKLDLKMSLKNL